MRHNINQNIFLSIQTLNKVSQQGCNNKIITKVITYLKNVYKPLCELYRKDKISKKEYHKLKCYLDKAMNILKEILSNIDNCYNHDHKINKVLCYISKVQKNIGCGRSEGPTFILNDNHKWSNNESFIINTPGNYLLSGDYSFSPKTQLEHAIVIDYHPPAGSSDPANNIFIDFCGYKLSQSALPYDITNIGIGDVSTITTSTPHNLTDGTIVRLSETNSTPNADGAFKISNVTTTTFDITFKITSVGDVGTITIPGCDAIHFGLPTKLNAPFHQVTVQNGNIQSFTGAGVWAAQFASEVGGASTNLTFCGLTIDDCGEYVFPSTPLDRLPDLGLGPIPLFSSGIALLGFGSLFGMTPTTEYQNISILNCNITNCKGGESFEQIQIQFPSAGIWVDFARQDSLDSDSFGLNIDHVNISEFESTTGTICVFLENCSNSNITNLTMDKNGDGQLFDNDLPVGLGGLIVQNTLYQLGISVEFPVLNITLENIIYKNVILTNFNFSPVFIGVSIFGDDINVKNWKMKEIVISNINIINSNNLNFYGVLIINGNKLESKNITVDKITMTDVVLSSILGIFYDSCIDTNIHNNTVRKLLVDGNDRTISQIFGLRAFSIVGGSKISVVNTCIENLFGTRIIVPIGNFSFVMYGIGVFFNSDVTFKNTYIDNIVCNEKRSIITGLTMRTINTVFTNTHINIDPKHENKSRRSRGISARGENINFYDTIIENVHSKEGDDVKGFFQRPDSESLINLTIKNLKVKNTELTGSFSSDISTVHGVDINSLQGNLIMQDIRIENTHNIVKTECITRGLNVSLVDGSASIDRVKITNITSVSNNDLFGIRLSGSSLSTMKNARVCKVKGSSNQKNPTGIALDFATKWTLENCHVENVINTGSNREGTATGVWILPGSSQISLNKCIVKNVSVPALNSIGNITSGILIGCNRDICNLLPYSEKVNEDIIINGCKITSIESKDNTVGIFSNGSVEKLILCNNKVGCVEGIGDLTGGIVVLNATNLIIKPILQNNYCKKTNRGFLLNNSEVCLYNNKTKNNLISGFQGVLSIFADSIFVNNKAIKNGNPCSDLTNYAVTPSPYPGNENISIC